MLRNVKVAVSKGLLDCISDHYQTLFMARSNIDLSFVGIPEAENVAESDLAELLSGVEVAVLYPKSFLKLGRFLPNSAKWIQLTWAGAEELQSVDEDFRKKMENCVITRAGGIFGDQMADYTIGAVISMERNFPALYEVQRQKNWKRPESIKDARTLSTLSIGILGLGDIGQRIAKSCNGVGMTAYGLKRTPSRVEYVEKVFTTNQLSELLQACDYICNVLPSTPQTRGLLNGDTLKICTKRKPGFINIGRGDIIKEEHLITALKKGWISKACLDVVEKEPLNKSSPLWAMENVIITPHIAGVGDELITGLFFKNLVKYISDQKLDYMYDWHKGY